MAAKHLESAEIIKTSCYQGEAITRKQSTRESSRNFETKPPLCMQPFSISFFLNYARNPNFLTF